MCPDGPEIRQLAKTILTMLEPVIQAAAALTPQADSEPGKCQQVWCPVCAVAAIAAGESHPLTALIGEHSAALLSLIRAMANQDDPDPPDDQSPQPPGGYQPIPVTVVE
jgi:hypothetical protein